MSDRTYIKDLQSAQLTEGVYAIHNCQLGQTRAGKPYIKCLLGDKTGQTAGRMWNASEEIYNSLPTDGFVEISGQAQLYQGNMQIVINKMHSHEPTDNQLRELLPSTDNNIDEMFAAVLKILQSLENEHVKNLANRYLEDGDLMDKFCHAPAAMSVHHAYLGGLLEHTLNLLKLCEAILPLYPKLNRDIVLFGLFLHDMGKTFELTWERGFSYTSDGNLVGHIARGAILLNEKAKLCADNKTPVPKAIMQTLEHIILSHHGEPEFGALKKPSTPEAIIISNLDNLDAKVNIALEATRGKSADNKPANLGGDFTDRIWALDTKLYKPDPTIAQE